MSSERKSSHLLTGGLSGIYAVVLNVGVIVALHEIYFPDSTESIEFFSQMR
jgi:hypothetical protein